MITEPEIEAYLKKVRCFIDAGKVEFSRRQKDKYTLGQLGISYDDAFAMVYELTPENYYQGPTPDHDFPEQEVMEFGLDDIFEDEPYPNSSLYIKLTFRPRNDDLFTMGFHPARYPMTYPYGKNKAQPVTE